MNDAGFVTNLQESFMKSSGPFIENSSDSSYQGSQTYEAVIIGQSELIEGNS